MTFPLECVCESAGTCAATGRQCSSSMFQRCQTDLRYRYLLSGIPRVEWPAELQPVPKPQPKPKRERTQRPEPKRVKTQCVHLGRRQLPPADPNGIACGCPAKEVWECDKHGRCTRGVKFEGVACCVGCPDFAADAEPFTRHLAYHLYPVSGNGHWQWNVSQLRRRLSLFNGRRVVAVVTDPASGRKPDPVGPFAPDTGRCIPGCDTFEDVVREFGDDAVGIEFIRLDNDPGLREGVSWVPLMERMPRGQRDAIWYAQAKGTTRAPNHIARRWAEVLYEVMFDYWPVVLEQLETYPITGPFKKHGPGWHETQHKSDWHYSGSWFAVRAADLFATDWQVIDNGWSCIEPLPSQKFGHDDAGCVFHEGRVPRVNLYSRGYWRRIVEPALAKWKASHAR